MHRETVFLKTPEPLPEPAPEDDPTHQIVANMHALNAERNEGKTETKEHGDTPQTEDKRNLVEACDRGEDRGIIDGLSMKVNVLEEHGRFISSVQLPALHFNLLFVLPSKVVIHIYIRPTTPAPEGCSHFTIAFAAIRY